MPAALVISPSQKLFSKIKSIHNDNLHNKPKGEPFFIPSCTEDSAVIFECHESQGWTAP